MLTAAAAAGDPTRKLFPEGDRKRREGGTRARGRVGGQAGGRTGGRVRADLPLALSPTFATCTTP